MVADIGWVAEKWRGVELVTVVSERESWHATGRMVIASDSIAAARYSLRCAGDGRFTALQLDVAAAGGCRTLEVTASADGQWTVDGNARPDLADCIDIDLNRTPLTNTLPIRRLDWALDQARDFVMAYVSVPELIVRAVPQRYTCVQRETAHRVFRYESGAFQADIAVDQAGLVLDYPGIWSRIPNASMELLR